MQLTKAFEQGVCVMAMLTTQVSDIPLASKSIHKHLGVSMTYLQKIVRKLVVSDLLVSVSGKNGGFQLARSAGDISYLDVVEAIEGPIDTFPNTNLIGRVLGDVADDEKIVKAEEALHETFRQADQLWRQSLAARSIESLVNESLNGQEFHPIDWNLLTPKNELLVKKIIKRRQ
ncbi:Rrf2 family transcriptional regulator [Streptococcaceae bacterium ESL0729]|nr:Rrf2 family transcriptional regulator [Streptococcaceae bacterium ESL0729]